MFAAFGRTPREVRTYSVNPPMLFFYEETDLSLATSFYAPHDDQFISRASENIAILAGELRRRYNVRLMLLPVPNKFTVYSRFVCRDSYDELIPRLISALKTRGIQAVDILTLFRSQTDMVYFSTDTHWNEQGMKLAVPLVAQYCQ